MLFFSMNLKDFCKRMDDIVLCGLVESVKYEYKKQIYQYKMAQRKDVADAKDGSSLSQPLTIDDVIDQVAKTYISKIESEKITPPSSEFAPCTLESIKNGLKKRFDKMNKEEYSIDETIPVEYLDPMFFNVMTDPVLAITANSQHIYDRRTFNKLNGVCPENKQRFIENRPHEELKREIAQFLSERDTNKVKKSFSM